MVAPTRHRRWPGALLRAICILCVGVPVGVRAQTNFDLRLGQEGLIVGAGIALIGGGSLLAHHNAGSEPPRIDIGNVPGFDRVATTQWSVRAQRTSDVLFGVTAVAVIAGSIVDQQGHRPLLPVAIIGESALLTAGLTSMVKELVRRPRPYMYNPDVPTALHNGERDFVSFWSGHTANAAAMTFSTAYIVQHSDASSGVKTATWIGAALVPAVMGYLRVRGGKHFPTDVLTGYAVGALVGIAVPYIHRTEIQRNEQ